MPSFLSVLKYLRRAWMRGDGQGSGPRMTPASESPAPGLVSRDQHTVSRKQISNNALRVLYRLHEAGFQSYVVGGAVRDLLMGIVPKDFDIATDAHPEQIRQLFRNCRLIGRRFRLAHIHFGREVIEVATFRGAGSGDEGERELDNGRLLRDNVYGTLEEDIFRRDFTANALYYNIADFSILDRVGGIADIRDRRLRLIGDPDARFREDPVRMLRAIRFAAKLDFSIEESASAAILQLAPLLADVPPARLFDEAVKLLLHGHARRSYEMLRHYGLLDVLLPGATGTRTGGDVGLDFVHAALSNSDDRVRDGKTLTPGFLLAALYWQGASREWRHRAEAGDEPTLAWQETADSILVPVSRRTAVPRRITLGTQEIWTLQHRLAQSGRRRVLRLLSHPRFRAAYDFLLLRGEVESETRELADWWRRAVELDGDALISHIDSPAEDHDSGGEPGERRSRRRRRRRGGRRRAASSTPATE